MPTYYLLSKQAPEEIEYVRRQVELACIGHGKSLNLLVNKHRTHAIGQRIDELDQLLDDQGNARNAPAEPSPAAHRPDRATIRREIEELKRKKGKILRRSTFDNCFRKAAGTLENQAAIHRFILDQEEVPQDFKDSLFILPKSEFGKAITPEGDLEEASQHQVETLVTSDSSLSTSGETKGRRPRVPNGIGRRGVLIASLVAASLAGLLFLASGEQTPAIVQLDFTVLPRGEKISVPIESASLPIAIGDAIRFEAHCSETRYLYLLSLDPCGDLQPMWPWEEFDWERLPPQPREQSFMFPEKTQRHQTVQSPEQGSCTGRGIHTTLLISANSPITDFSRLRNAVLKSGYAQETLRPEQENLLCRIDNHRLVDIHRQEFGLSESRALFAPSATRDASNPVAVIMDLIANALPDEVESVDAICFALGDRYE